MTAHQIGSVLVPFFVALACGFIAAQRRWIPPAATTMISRFVLNFALPALIIDTLSKPDTLAHIDPLFMVAHLAGVLIIFAAMMALTHHLFGLCFKRALLEGYSAAYANGGFLGLPIIIALLGDWAAAPAGSILAVELALVAPLVLFLLDRQVGLLPTFFKAFRNPLLLATLFGFTLATVGMTVPPLAQDTLKFLGSGAAPAALFALGAAVVTTRIGATMAYRQVLIISVMKLLIHPLVAWILMVHVFSLEPHWCQAGVLIAAMPTAATVFIYAKHCNLHTQVTSNTILVSTLCALVTVPVIALLMLQGIE